MGKLQTTGKAIAGGRGAMNELYCLSAQATELLLVYLVQYVVAQPARQLQWQEPKGAAQGLLGLPRVPRAVQLAILKFQLRVVCSRGCQDAGIAGRYCLEAALALSDGHSLQGIGVANRHLHACNL